VHYNLKILIVSFFLVFHSGFILAQGYFESTPDIEEAYRLVSTLRFDEGKEKIAKIKRNDPNNKLVYLIENYIDFFTIFINEEEIEYKRLEVNKDYRLKQIKQGNKDSPYYRFAIAEIHLQWATVRLKFGERTKPAREVLKAYKLLEKNKTDFPNFIANKKSLSIIHALCESLPGWVRTLMGIKGSIELGTDEIDEVVSYAADNNFLFTEESYAIYAYILFFQNNKKKEAYNLLTNADLDHSQSPLICFLKANIAHKNGYNEEAKKILEERPSGDAYMPFPYLDFMYGRYKLYSLDADASDYILNFINDFEGRHFVKEAYQKLAWYELALNEDISAYKKYMKLCKDKGFKLVDEDKQALKESENKEIPNATLLRARLLFDGGYYSKAYALLVKRSYMFIEAGADQLEFNYRMGRISHELQNYPDAIEFYSITINTGIKSKSYMACNSALQIGLILEEQKKHKQSRRFYKQCLDISPDEYKSSLHQKAKSGIERVRNLIH
jgi:TolA-binding protein